LLLLTSHLHLVHQHCQQPLFHQCSLHPPPLHSFPTRRSSDLPPARWATNRPRSTILTPVSPTLLRMASDALDLVLRLSFFDSLRSEEHTSELQSRVDLVCRLLLEKKKKQRRPKTTEKTSARKKDTDDKCVTINQQ